MKKSKNRTKVSKKVSKVPNGVLAEGEATGHSHKVAVDVFKRKDGLREFEGPTTVEHEEHNEIDLPDKAFVSGRVRELDHYTKQARTVQD